MILRKDIHLIEYRKFSGKFFCIKETSYSQFNKKISV